MRKQNLQFEDAIDAVSREGLEDLLYEMAVAADLDTMRPVRSLTIANGTNVTLVGANHASRASAQFSAKVVRDVQPSALILELCSERLGVLIRGNGHRETEAKDWMNPDEPEAIRRQYRHYADETRKAFRAFVNSPEPGGRQKLLVLADIKDSIVEEAGIESMMCRRDANLASNIRSTALLGHKSIVAVLGANHLCGVSAALNFMIFRLEVVPQSTQSQGVRCSCPVKAISLPCFAIASMPCS